MMEENLLTAQQFSILVKKWGLRVKQLAKASLATGTSSTGALRNYLDTFVDDNKDKAPYKIKFYFERYGVYRAYGVGRGYVMINGLLVRGTRIRSDREIRAKKFNEVAASYLEKGYKKSEVNRLKSYTVGSERTTARTPLDWIDQHVDAHIMQLADHVQEYYGDKSLRDLLLDFNKIKIVKS